MKCDNIHDRLQQFIRGELPESDMVLFQKHIDGCSLCQEHYKLLRVLDVAFRELPTSKELQDLWPKIVEHAALPERGMRPDVLATSGEVFAFARIPEKEQVPALVATVNYAVDQLTVSRYGSHWNNEILPENIERFSSEIQALATIRVFEPNPERAPLLEKLVEHTQFCVRSTYQVVRHFLRRTIGIKEASSGLGVVRAAKGEFAHWDEVKERFSQARVSQADVKILKGDDNRLSRVSNEAESRGIPCRSWKPARPAVRYYLVDKSYLLLFSHGRGHFTFFGGQDPEGVKATERLFQLDWGKANPANDLAQE